MEHNPSDMPPHGYYQHHVDVPASMHHDRLDQPQEEGLRKQDHTLVPNLNSRRPGADSMGSVFANASHGLTGDNQRKLAGYWQKTITETENSEHDFKSHALPLARIKKVMKADEDVKMISAEAPIIFAKGCEIFITELTMRAWIHAEENKRRTLQRSDIANAISRSDMFDFLIDIVPREEFVAGSHGVSESNPNAQPVAGAAGGFMGMTLGHAAVQPHPAVQQVPQHVLQDHSRGPVGSPYYSHGPLKPEEPPVNGHYQHHSHMQQQQQQQQQQQPLPPQQQRHQSQHPQHPQQHHQPPQQPPQHMYDHNRFMPPVQNMPSMAQQHPAYLDQMGYHQGFNQHNGAPQYSNPYGNPYVNQQQSQQQQSHHVSLLHHHHQQQQQQHGRDGEMEDPNARYGHR